MALMGLWGHGASAATIVALVISTAFLVWVAGKQGQPFVKFGKVIAWIAIVLTALLIVSQLYMCVDSYRCGRFGPMKGMWKHGGRGMFKEMRKGMPPPHPLKEKMEIEKD